MLKMDGKQLPPPSSQTSIEYGQLPLSLYSRPQQNFSDYESYPSQFISTTPGTHQYLLTTVTTTQQQPGGVSVNGGAESSSIPPSPTETNQSSRYILGHYDDLNDYHLQRITPTTQFYQTANSAEEAILDNGNSAIVYGYVQTTDNTTATQKDSIELIKQQIEQFQLNDSSAVSVNSVHPVAGATKSLTPRWRDPNLVEVISFLTNSDNIIRANAAAYLQHLCYMDDPNKQRTRTLGGIPPLITCLQSEAPDVYRNACGALRNLSYGRQNDENKRAIRSCGGLTALITLLRRCQESEVKELVTGVIWNMSSCEDLKSSIIDEAMLTIVAFVILPHSGWDLHNPGEPCWSTVFRNASGVLRNISSAGLYARQRLRECQHLCEALLYVIRIGIEKNVIGNKIIENIICILRNLSYRCQEVEDPNYDRLPLATSDTFSAPAKEDKENLGCFGASKRKAKLNPILLNDVSVSVTNDCIRQTNGKYYEQLWRPDVVQFYLTLLQSCSNPETLEAAAGALQNLAACYWQPSIEIRAAVRKEKGLPILVELLRMEVDRVVCAVATALRNLAIDQRNKELIGKYAMRDLIQKLPNGNQLHDSGTSDDTIAAVLATLNEVIKRNAEFSRSLLDAGGVDRLLFIVKQRSKYTTRVLKFAGQVLFTMWQHQELRDVYKKHGFKETDFVAKTIATRHGNDFEASSSQASVITSGTPNSPNNSNNTLNRPMASQSSTRYEDRTIKKQHSSTINVCSSSPSTKNYNDLVGNYAIYHQQSIADATQHSNGTIQRKKTEAN